MNKIVIFYFSGTGNTWWVSERIAETLKGMGVEASAHSIEQVSVESASALIEDADAVGLGFPIYGSDVPRNFLRFLEALPEQAEGKDTLGFVTQMAWSGDGFNFLRKMMAAKGYRVRWTAEFNMPNNVAIPFIPLPYSAEYARFKKQLEKAQEKIVQLCKVMVNGDDQIEHDDLFSTASAWIQRGPFRWMHDWAGRLWSVEAEACTSCERCARICPADNIRMADGVPVHGDDCILCLRCFNYCPTLAIHYAGLSNRRAEKNPPFKGPVMTFKPELICDCDK